MTPREESLRALTVMQVIGSMEIGGEQRYLARLTSRLPHDEFRQIVVYTHGDAMLKEFPEPIRCVQVLGRKPSAKNLKDWSLFREFQKIIRENSVDIVATHGTGITQIMASRAGRKARIPVIHTIQRPFGNRSPTEDWTIRIPLLRQYIYGLTDHFIALGSYYLYDQRTNWKIPPEKLHMSYIGIDLSDYRPDSDARRSVREEFSLADELPVIGVVARHSPEKGIDRGIRAFQDTLGHLQDARLLLVGDGPLHEKFKSMVQEMGLGENVLFTGARYDSARLMNGCDVIMQTTPNPLNGISSIEAMASGKPVITLVDIEEEEKMAADTCEEGQNGLYFRTALRDESARNLANLLQDPRGLEEMGRRSREMAEARFAIETHVKAMADFYRGRVKG